MDPDASRGVATSGDTGQKRHARASAATSIARLSQGVLLTINPAGER